MKFIPSMLAAIEAETSDQLKTSNMHKLARNTWTHCQHFCRFEHTLGGGIKKETTGAKAMDELCKLVFSKDGTKHADYEACVLKIRMFKWLVTAEYDAQVKNLMKDKPAAKAAAKKKAASSSSSSAEKKQKVVDEAEKAALKSFMG